MTLQGHFTRVLSPWNTIFPEHISVLWFPPTLLAISPCEIPTQASFVEILSIPDITNIPSQYFFLPRQSYPCPLYYMQMYVLESWGYMHRYFPWISEKHVKLNIFKIDLWSPILCTPSNWSFFIKPHKKNLRDLSNYASQKPGSHLWHVLLPYFYMQPITKP